MPGAVFREEFPGDFQAAVDPCMACSRMVHQNHVPSEDIRRKARTISLARRDAVIRVKGPTPIGMNRHPVLLPRIVAVSRSTNDAVQFGDVLQSVIDHVLRLRLHPQFGDVPGPFGRDRHRNSRVAHRRLQVRVPSASLPQQHPPDERMPTTASSSLRCFALRPRCGLSCGSAAKPCGLSSSAGQLAMQPAKLAEVPLLGVAAVVAPGSVRVPDRRLAGAIFLRLASAGSAWDR